MVAVNGQWGAPKGSQTGGPGRKPGKSGLPPESPARQG